jgi:hypothetical protein
MSLFLCEDEEIKGITYELLDKKNPLCAVLGNITNCCQIIDAAGSECVEYGMTKPNSGFITFNYKDTIIAQSWVWYDSVSKTVCLDNIEVPHRYLEKINKSEDIKNSFIECLVRISRNFKTEMNKHGLKVKKVTIGKGHNDIKSILDGKFAVDEDPDELDDYEGYSDADVQYEIDESVLVKRR